MTLPPPAWMAAISAPKDEAAMGCVVSPFQYAVHEPGDAVCRKASARYRAPDAWDRAARPPSVVS